MDGHLPSDSLPASSAVKYCLDGNRYTCLPRLLEPYSGSLTTQRICCICPSRQCQTLRTENNSSSGVTNICRSGGKDEIGLKIREKYHSILSNLFNRKSFPQKSRINNLHFHPSLLRKHQQGPLSYITSEELAIKLYGEKLAKSLIVPIEDKILWYVVPTMDDKSQPLYFLSLIKDMEERREIKATKEIPFKKNFSDTNIPASLSVDKHEKITTVAKNENDGTFLALSDVKDLPRYHGK